MRRKQLNEGYAIIIRQHDEKVLLFVEGKQVSEHVALTYNHLQDVYTYTFICTGMSITKNLKTYETIREAERDFQTTVKQFEQAIRNGEMLGTIITARTLYNNLIRDKKFYQEFL